MTDKDQAEQKENISQKRAAFYIDGFNLYHAIDDMQKPHLKWVSYWKLFEKMLDGSGESLVKVVWCTAKSKKNAAKGDRHDRMVGAQRLEGVTIKLGHFIDETRDCWECKTQWPHPNEKEGDINVAISVMRDGFHNEYDHAYIVTADTDQVATVRMFKEEFQDKQITMIAPPGRKRSEHLHGIVGRTLHITEDFLEHAIMPAVMISPSPRTIPTVRMPEQYAPPAGWVHPSNRPVKK